MNLLELPDCMLEEIFLYLSYDEIANKRLVCTKIKTICESVLNRSFAKLEYLIGKRIEKLKPLLPRKESQRWNNAAHNEIQFLRMISKKNFLLYCNYEEYIREDICCFTPGKVIDLSLSMLRHETCPEHWLSDENFVLLTDLICMAQEYFQNRIEPTLRKIIDEKTKTSKISLSFCTANTLYSLLPVEETAITTPLAIQQNSKECQFQNGGNCRSAYLSLNQKYENLLRKVNLNSKAIKNQLTNSRKENADLRRRLEKFESENQRSIGNETGGNHLVTKRDLKKIRPSSKRLTDGSESQNRSAIGDQTDANHLDIRALRSRKRLADDGKSQNRNVDDKRADENSLLTGSNHKKVLRSSKRLAERKQALN